MYDESCHRKEVFSIEYSIDKLARLSGVTSRTLRHYNSIGLLNPLRKNSAGYRIYGPREVDRLQQILFFRDLGMELKQIGALLDNPHFDEATALKEHLARLLQEQHRLGSLIKTVEKTLLRKERGTPMTDKEKFEGFKTAKIQQNESLYGAEIREKYGEDIVNASNKLFQNMKKEDYDAMQALDKELRSGLENAVRQGVSPTSEAGAALARLHRNWLGYTWPSYSHSAHLGLCQMYLDDARFTAYYDKNQTGCAAFLQKAVAALPSQ